MHMKHFAEHQGDNKCSVHVSSSCSGCCGPCCHYFTRPSCHHMTPGLYQRQSSLENGEVGEAAFGELILILFQFLT